MATGSGLFGCSFAARAAVPVSEVNRVISATKLAIEKEDKSVQTPSYMNITPCAESLSEDLSQLVGQSSYSDVTLTCDGRNVSVHKCILSTRSKVFAAMFSSDMAESKTGVVKVQDVDPAVFDQFVRYLYTGTLPDLTVVTARHLYEVGDKYAITGLMRRCSHFLEANAGNVCDMLILADAHGDQKFKEGVIGYILQKEIPLQDDIWLDFCKSQPTLAIEVLNRFCRSTRDGSEDGQRKRPKVE